MIKMTLMVAYPADERPPHEETPEEQLKGCGYTVVSVGCFSWLRMVVGDGGSTVILLSDVLLARNPQDLAAHYNQHDSLIYFAKEKGLDGIGIMADSYFAKPYTMDSEGLSIVVTGECSRFGIRDWSSLLKKVEKQINKRMKEELREPPTQT